MMTVDQTYTEKWMTSGTFSLLTSSKAFVAGSKEPFKLLGTSSKNNFFGCMRKVSPFTFRFTFSKTANSFSRMIRQFQFDCQLHTQVEFVADSLRLDLIQLAMEGNRLINTYGSIAFECQPPLPAQPVAFTSSDSHIVSNQIFAPNFMALHRVPAVKLKIKGSIRPEAKLVRSPPLAPDARVRAHSSIYYTYVMDGKFF